MLRAVADEEVIKRLVVRAAEESSQVGRVIRATRIASGARNLVFDLEASGGGFVAKVFLDGDRCAQEVAVYDVLGERPSVRHAVSSIVTSRAHHPGRCVLITTKLVGSESVLPKLSLVERVVWAEALGVLMAEFSDLTRSPSEFGYPAGPRLDSWQAFLQARLRIASKECCRLGIIEAGVDELIGRRLEAKAAWLVGAKPSLVHGDLVPKNVLSVVHEGRLERVQAIDFECAFFGSLEWDLVNLERTVFRCFPETRRPLLESWVRTSKEPSFVSRRFDAYDALEEEYAALEALEFFVWGHTHGLESEVREGARVLQRRLKCE
jgi:Ser/Thr protein kinase RdoA (MazF antagonist)